MFSVTCSVNRKLDKHDQSLNKPEISFLRAVRIPFLEIHALIGDITKSTFISGQKTAKIALQQNSTNIFGHF